MIAALSNIFEGDEGDEDDNTFSSLYLKEALQLCMTMLQSNFTIVQESAMSCMAALSRGCPDDYAKYVDELIPKFFMILKNANQKHQKNLRAMTLESISLITATLADSPD